MRVNSLATRPWAGVLVLLITALIVAPAAAGATPSPVASVPKSIGSRSYISITTRSGAALFQGEAERPSTEIHYDPNTRHVTIRLSIQAPQGYVIPNIRRDNFLVYENGVRQTNVAVDIEHQADSLIRPTAGDTRSP